MTVGFRGFVNFGQKSKVLGRRLHCKSKSKYEYYDNQSLLGTRV